MQRPEITPKFPVISRGNCQITIGTCGYSYTEWIDHGFYPPGIKNSEMLCQYAYLFQAVELNYTWYQMARAKDIQRMVDKSPANFRFSAKLTRTLTHERDSDWQKQLKLFKEGIAPLRSQLIAILIQLPPDFTRNVTNRKYLANILDGLADFPVAVEFRHRSWATDAVFGELERRKVSLVTVDEPELDNLFPALDVVTNPALFYVRFHGRNVKGWNSSNMQKKFDYDYSKEELYQYYNQYLAPMVDSCHEGVIFFNNHVRAQAPQNAQVLSKIINA